MIFLEHIRAAASHDDTHRITLEYTHVDVLHTCCNAFKSDLVITSEIMGRKASVDDVDEKWFGND